MTNLLTPLKKLGKKMTGKDIAGTNLVTVVDDIANKYDGGGGSGGGGLDNDNLVLKLSEGVYVADDDTYSFAPLTFKDIIDTLDSGRNVAIVDDRDWPSPYVANWSLNLITYGQYWFTSVEEEITCEVDGFFGNNIHILVDTDFSNYESVDAWLAQPVIIANL